MKKIKVTGKKVGMSAPEHRFASALKAFFSWDEDEIYVGQFDEETKSITITCGNAEVLVALEKYIKKSVKSGTNDVTIVLKAANEEVEAAKADVKFADFEEEMDALFKDVFSYLGVETAEDEDGNVIGKFVTFRDDCLLQFYADDLSNPFGMESEVPAKFAAFVLDLQGQASITTQFVGA